MSNQLNCPFGSISIHDYYLIAVMNEGVTVTDKVNTIIMGIIDRYYKGKSFIYIAHRLNSYAVDPNVYKKVAQIKNLTGIAIVSTKQVALNNAEIERLFITIPFETFNTLDEATHWASTILH